MPEPPSVAALVTRYALHDNAASRLDALIDFVAGDPAAPTTVTDLAGIVRDHIADSLVALELEPVRRARVIADLGAGAGFPGLPLAIALPRAEVNLVEGNGRKCDFMTRAVAVCEASNAVVVETRAESWAAGSNRCDVVVARALAPLAVVAEYAAPLLRVGGTLVAWRGRRDPGDEAQGARAAEQLGLEPADPVWVEPYEGALNRHLHAMVKVVPTPARFPRRPGMARKRPLN